jgi:hypothetical protein
MASNRTELIPAIAAADPRPSTTTVSRAVTSLDIVGAVREEDDFEQAVNATAAVMQTNSARTMTGL